MQDTTTIVTMGLRALGFGDAGHQSTTWSTLSLKGIEAENTKFFLHDITNPKTYAMRMYKYETGTRYSYL